jgi:hypothetical protein
MKKLITTAAAATLLLAAPLAAFAGDRGHGYGGWGPPQGQGWKHGHAKQGHWRAAPRVYYPAAPVYYPAAPVYYPAPRVVVPPPVFVPAPVVAVPAPYPYPQGPVGNVSIGFRFFF